MKSIAYSDVGIGNGVHRHKTDDPTVRQHCRQSMSAFLQRTDLKL